MNTSMDSLNDFKNAISLEDENLLLSSFENLSTQEGKVEEYLEILSKELATHLFQCLESIVKRVTLELTSDNEDSNIEIKTKQLTTVIKLITLYSKGNKIRPPSFISVLIQLHDLLGNFQQTSDLIVHLKNTISLCGEKLYLASEKGTNQYLPQLTTYLLVEALKPTSKESNIKRLYTIRNGFQEIDFSNAGTIFNKELILRCFVHPAFLKSNEGKKFLSSLLISSGGLIINNVVDLIKQQISTGIKTLSNIYGEMLERTWRDAPDEKIRHSIEDIIQDFLKEAAHCSDPKYFKGLRFLIKTFHDIKRTDLFDEMLVNVFEPILWRSLKCANAIVRLQTAVLFLDVFPLQKFSANPELSDSLLQKQFDQLTSLLKDSDHRVRATAVTGVCHILRAYWDILPAGTIHNILKYIFETLAFDVSSANVRFAVISGIQDLLQQPLAHTSLKALLPLIGNLIHDRSERNRLAFVDMLNQIKDIRNIFFYEIVSVNHLLARLSEDRDNSQMTSSMCSLLLNSFYPQNSGSDKASERNEQIERCIQFIDECPVAAEAFYSNIHNHIPIGSVSKLIIMLYSILTSNLAKLTMKRVDQPKGNDGGASKGKRRRQDINNANESEKSLEEEKEFLFNLSSVILHMLKSIETDLKGQEPSLQLIFKYFSSKALINWTELILLHLEDEMDFCMLHIALQTTTCIASFHRLSSQSTSSDELNSMVDSFNINFFVANYLPNLELCENLSLRQMLISSMVELFNQLKLQVSLVSTISDSFTNFLSILKGKSSKNNSENVLSILDSSPLYSTLIEISCNPQANFQIKSSYLTELEKLNSLVVLIADKMKQFSVIKSINRKEVNAVLNCVRAQMIWTVYLSASEALVNKAKGSSSLSETLDSIFAFIGNNDFKKIKWDSDSPSSSSSLFFHFWIELTNITLLILSDGLHLFGQNYQLFAQKITAVSSTLETILSRSVSLLSPETHESLIPSYFVSMNTVWRLFQLTVKIKGQLSSEETTTLISPLLNIIKMIYDHSQDLFLNVETKAKADRLCEKIFLASLEANICVDAIKQCFQQNIETFDQENISSNKKTSTKTNDKQKMSSLSSTSIMFLTQEIEKNPKYQETLPALYEVLTQPVPFQG